MLPSVARVAHELLQAARDFVRQRAVLQERHAPLFLLRMHYCMYYLEIRRRHAGSLHSSTL
jgi:hypothetical protein